MLQSLAAVRALALLLALTTTAAADDGFEWDPPPAPEWEFRATSVIQGKPDRVPYAGLHVGIDHRIDRRVWGGFAIASMLARQYLEDTPEVIAPLQTATWLAATARVQLGEHEDDDVWFAWEARGELGTAFVTQERMRSTPAVGSIGLTGRVGGRRTRGLLSMGWAFALAGSRTGIDPGGIDVRMGVARAW